MKKNTLFTIFICSILLSGSFFAIFSSLNFSPFVFAQEQEAESSTDPPADTSTTDPPADTSTTGPPADTSTTDPPADTQPVIIEEDNSTDEVFEKEITISPTISLDTEVVVSTEIPENLVEQGVEFQLYQVDGTTKTDVTFDDTVAVELVDTDGDNVADELQWQASQTSEQTFLIQGIIVTTAAEHLDSSRAFIENVYDKTNTQDGIWTDPIPVDDYIRVTFEKPLTSYNDITIFAKSDSIAGVKVYEKDSDTVVADFGPIAEDGMYRVYLTNLSAFQDTFDLKVSGSPVQFDHIIDPTALDWTQCENDNNMNGVLDSPLCTWVTGSLDFNHNNYAEGNNIPDALPSSGKPTGEYTTTNPGHVNFRGIIRGLDAGTYDLTIKYQFTKGGKVGYDFLTTLPP